jgi:di/tricarboxylate transporter
LIALSGIFLATSLLNQFIPGGSSVPALLAPIAIATAQGLGVDPRPFALIVAVATGTSLLTPFAHPVNVLVMGPGRYKTKDYLKAGLPLVIVAFVISILGISFFYHLV